MCTNFALFKHKPHEHRLKSRNSWLVLSTLSRHCQQFPTKRDSNLEISVSLGTLYSFPLAASENINTEKRSQIYNLQQKIIDY